MDVNDHATDAAVVHELSKLADGVVPAVVFSTSEGREFTVARDDFQVREITRENALTPIAPKLIEQRPVVRRTVSLSSYVNRFKDDNSVLFADIASNQIVGVIDYHKRPVDSHQEGPANEPSVVPYQPGVARFNKHVVTLQLDFSKEWLLWTQNSAQSSEKLMRHEDFATFLEENAVDVETPNGADLLEICRDLNVKSGTEFKSSVRMGDTVHIEYQKGSDVSTSGKIELPTVFILSIPVYFGEPHVKVTCFMRRKVDDGSLFLGYKLMRAENIRQEDFQRIAGAVNFDTGLPLYYGKS